MSFLRFMLLLLVSVAPFSCADDAVDEYSSRYRVSFMCNLMTYQQEYTVISGLGVSQYVTLRKSGSRILMTTPTGKEISDNVLVNTAMFAFGRAGLIIGRSTFLEGDYCCFDLACPNCDAHSRLSRLSITQTTGEATCPDCSNVYGLNNNGALIGRHDETANSAVRPLYRYRVRAMENRIEVSN